MYSIQQIINITKQAKLYGQHNDNNNILLLPYDDLHKSGLASITALSHASQDITDIIFLCTYKDGNKLESTLRKLQQEFSYSVNLPLIRHFYPDANIQSALVGKFNTQFADNIIQLLQQPNTLLICTSNLITYGENTSIIFPQPEQTHANNIEAPIIQSFINGNFNKGYDALNNSQVEIHGRHLLRTLLYITNKLHLHGTVHMYYDSSAVNYNNIIDTIAIKYKSSSFTRYLSMTFSQQDPMNLTPFDKLQLIASAKSVIDTKIRTKKNILPNNFIVPSWSIWHTHLNGIFLSINNAYTQELYACTGEYQSPDSEFVPNISIAQHIINTALQCIQDIELTPTLIPQLQYTINILQLQPWQQYTYQEIIKSFDINTYNNTTIHTNNESDDNDSSDELKPLVIKGIHGIYLKLPDNSSAIFLPHFWTDNSHWDIHQLLKQLMHKAGAFTLDKSTISIFKTDVL
jgi:hypothetical protein